LWFFGLDFCFSCKGGILPPVAPIIGETPRAAECRPYMPIIRILVPTPHPSSFPPKTQKTYAHHNQKTKNGTKTKTFA